jgi:hypothetical protein
MPKILIQKDPAEQLPKGCTNRNRKKIIGIFKKNFRGLRPIYFPFYA